MNEALLSRLREASGGLDALHAWPEAPLKMLATAGVLGWVIPEPFGGSNLSQRDLLAGYLDLASACLTTTFVLTQRNGACQRIAASGNESLRRELLPALARGELFATVGISHLTTSRQHWQRPTVVVEPDPGGWRWTGEVPWVTGASQADYIVTGGTLPDGNQILAAISTRLPGVEIAPSIPLLALGGSQTAAVNLNQVVVDSASLLAGPAPQVMKQGSGGSTGSLATSALAVGHSRAALEQFREELQRRPELGEIVEPLSIECSALQADLFLAVDAAGTRSAAAPDLSAEALRSRANSLVLRSTQALLAASKGAGFVAGHFAERAVREALFFLVWSCPQPVLTAALRGMAGNR
ncbi:MAG: acyl-CoA dehydrogenase family protein [Planctomycetales bacterium]